MLELRNGSQDMEHQLASGGDCIDALLWTDLSAIEVLADFLQFLERSSKSIMLALYARRGSKRQDLHECVIGSVRTKVRNPPKHFVYAFVFLGNFPDHGLPF